MVDLVFDILITRSKRRPMPIDGHPNVLLFQLAPFFASIVNVPLWAQQAQNFFDLNSYLHLHLNFHLHSRARFVVVGLQQFDRLKAHRPVKK